MSNASSDNIKNSTEPSDEHISSPPPKTLSDMPLEVVGLIVEKSDYKEQLILRKVSKSLRSLVDQQKPSCTLLHFNVYKEHIRCYYNKQSVLYVKPKSEQIERWMRKEKNNGTSILIVKEDYEKIALEDLEYTLKNPKLHQEILSFKTFNNFQRDELSKSHRPCLEICRVLNGINHQISAKEYEIQWARPSKDLQILPFLNPRVLEKITVTNDWAESETKRPKTFEKIFQLEQWKQAKELQLMDVLARFPLEHATHFKRFQIFDVCYNELIRIRDFLSQLDDFECCTFTFPSTNDYPYLSTLLGKLAASNERTEAISHYSIPDSNDYLEFLFFEKLIEVRRKKR